MPLSFFATLPAIAFSAAAIAMPVIPGAAGFGIETAAGRGGTVKTVTSLADRGAGTLREALEARGARTVIFATSGNINLTSDITIANPYITIAGQTAPSPGIQITGASIRVRTHDVLIQHIRIRPGIALGPTRVDERDGITLLTSRTDDTYNIVLDHVSLAWSTDGLLDAFASSGRSVRDVTIRNSILAEPLRCPPIASPPCLHSHGHHNFASLINGAKRITVWRNLYVRGDARNPKIGNATDVAVVGNVIYRPGNYDSAKIRLDNHSRQTAFATIEGNVVITRNGAGNNKAVSVNGTGAVQLYLANNTVIVPHPPGRETIYSPSDPWDTSADGVLVLNDGHTVANTKVMRRPASSWPAGLPVPTGDIETQVLACAGARPADRDADDRRIVHDVVNRTGPDFVHVPPNDGPQVLARNTIIHRRPANPHADDDGDGYTNLEEWLHARAAEVESTPGRH